MRRHQIAAASVALIMGAGGSPCADSTRAQAANVQVLPLGSDIILAEDQLLALEDSAIDGSIEAAERVVQHFTQQTDREALVYWARIAAENGSRSGQQLLGILLGQSTDPRDRRRAGFWRARGKEASRAR